MKRMSAPPSSISVAIVWRKRWQAPCLPIPAASGLFDVLPDDVTERGTPQRFALHGQEQGHVVRLGRKPGPRLVQILVEPRDGPLADWDYAILLALALADGHDARRAVHVVEFEIDKLRAPHPGRVKRLQ